MREQESRLDFELVRLGANWVRLGATEGFDNDNEARFGMNGATDWDWNEIVGCCLIDGERRLSLPAVPLMGEMRA
jgi:hypothetical protein